MRTPLRVTGSIGVLLFFCITSGSDVRAQRENGAVERTSNHPYTANILNEPQADPDAYRRSSPIYFASGLKSPLLICRGMLDTNVLFQHTVRLVQRLVELRKENWELAAYPVEGHGFEAETSWADEYSRILRLFETNLKGLKAQ